jgi:hypothetical protein
MYARLLLDEIIQLQKALLAGVLLVQGMLNIFSITVFSVAVISHHLPFSQ